MGAGGAGRLFSSSLTPGPHKMEPEKGRDQGGQAQSTPLPEPGLPAK